MPVYMDRHYMEGATLGKVSEAHLLDLEVQDKYELQFLTYWFDEARSTAFCLVDAPSKDVIQKAHDEAHGNVPHEIIEVDPTIVESFLGRLKDPTPADNSKEVPIDSAFRGIMFTDLKDSTMMTTVYGDKKALHLLHIHNSLTRNTLRSYQGNEIKHTGDGFMVSFTSIVDQVKCAITIQKEFATHNKRSPDEALYLRIGLSAGEPIEEHGDFFGTAVQLSARLCSHAEPSQILAAQEVRDKCQEEALSFSDGGEITPKGFDQPIPIHKVEWEEA